MEFFMDGAELGQIGVFATMVAIITEVLKNLLPKRFPTKILATLVSFIVVIGYNVVFGEVSASSIFMSIFGSFVVSFISMFGYDQFKETILRFKSPENGGES